MIQKSSTMMNLISNPKNRLFQFSKLSQIEGITHFVTTRIGGESEGAYSSFNLSEYTGDDPARVAENRLSLCAEIGIPGTNLYVPYQTHSDRIAVLDELFLQKSAEEKHNALQNVDALITNQIGVCIGVTTADCVPILLYDPINKVVAAVHAGWRGTIAKIASKTVETMVSQFGSQPNDLIAAIGPSIGPDSFEVGEEVAQQFEASGYSHCVLRNREKPNVDLWKTNCTILTESGIPFDQIEIAGVCTYISHQNYFSARRLGIHSGRSVSGIMIKKLNF